MKRAIFPAIALALILAIPALSQDDGAKDELVGAVAALTEVVEKQQSRIEELEAYVAKTRSQAASLHRKLKFAEKNGFTFPAPHSDAKEALLFGLQDFAAVASGGSPKKRK